MPTALAGADDIGKLKVEEAGEEEGEVRAESQAQGWTPSNKINA